MYMAEYFIHWLLEIPVIILHLHAGKVETAKFMRNAAS